MMSCYICSEGGTQTCDICNCPMCNQHAKKCHECDGFTCRHHGKYFIVDYRVWVGEDCIKIQPDVYYKPVA